MKSYEYTSLNRYMGVSLWSTDPKTLDRILDELGQVAAAFGVTGYGVLTRSLPSGGKYYIRIHQLRNKDEEVMWWILGQLTHQGWEPFARDEQSQYDYHLRLENSEKR